MTLAKTVPLVIHGWSVFAHPLLITQLESLVREVEAHKRKDPTGFVKKNATKRLAAIARLAFDVIPQDPTRAEYRQGGTLGDDHKHWFRAKFFQQYRLLFRYHASAKVIVYAWVAAASGVDGADQSIAPPSPRALSSHWACRLPHPTHPTHPTRAPAAPTSRHRPRWLRAARHGCPAPRFAPDRAR